MNDETDPSIRLEIAPTAGGVVLNGEIDVYTAPTLANWLAPLQDASSDVSIDLAGVGFIDSSGLGVLIEAHRRAVDTGRRLVLARPSPAVLRLIEISGLADHLTLSGEMIRDPMTRDPA